MFRKTSLLQKKSSFARFLYVPAYFTVFCAKMQEKMQRASISEHSS